MRITPMHLIAVPPVAMALGACGSSPPEASAQMTGTGYSAHVDNPWFPLKPGTTFRYRGTKDGKQAREVLRVTHRTKTIQGAPNVVLSDKLYLDGRLAEATVDWYSQDRAGNVWYFGERTATLDRKGRVLSREGSFQAGVDGARAGIYMPAHPKVGQRFEQEHYPGHAEDRFPDRGPGCQREDAVYLHAPRPLHGRVHALGARACATPSTTCGASATSPRGSSRVRGPRSGSSSSP